MFLNFSQLEKGAMFEDKEEDKTLILQVELWSLQFRQCNKRRSLILVMLIIKTSLSETCIGSISGHDHDHFGKHPFDNYENVSEFIK